MKSILSNFFPFPLLSLLLNLKVCTLAEPSLDSDGSFTSLSLNHLLAPSNGAFASKQSLYEHSGVVLDS